MGRAKDHTKRRETKRGRGSVFARVGGFLAALAPRGGGETMAHIQEIKGLSLIAFSAWLFVSLVSYEQPYAAVEGTNWGGQAGMYLADWVLTGVGWSGFLLVLLGLCWGTVLVTQKRIAWPALRLFGTNCLLFSTALLFELALGSTFPRSSDLPYGPGGWPARALAGHGLHRAQATPILVPKLGGPGLWILVLVAVAISFMLATEMGFYPALLSARTWFARRRAERGETPPRAAFGWIGRMFVGLWDFLSGRDLELEPGAASTGSAVAGDRPGAPTSGRTGELFAAADSQVVEEAEDGDAPQAESPSHAAERAEAGAAGVADATEEASEDELEEDDAGEDDEAERDSAETRPPALTPATRRRSRSPKQAVAPTRGSGEPPTPPSGPWRLPPLDLLERARSGGQDDVRSIETQARRIEGALQSFRVEANVVGARIGPAVTLYELEVAQGTRLNKVTQLSQEIAAALRAKSVRMIAPIPGKATIGIEVPNEHRRVVRLSELVTQRAYDPKQIALPLFMGIDVEGNPVVEDLSRMPHLLIAGTTGSGKSVCINSILVSLLLTRSPHDVQLILVDPKMVELQQFARIPHLMLPVVTDMRQATQVMLWAIEKMEGRYELFQSVGVRNIKAYNALGEEGLRKALGEAFSPERTPRHVPYIVIVIDEMADLMMSSKKEAELAITRLAQKSRAVGLHVIVATQRPSTDVITGVLKANLSCRIAFQVASKVDSRVILDAMGAEKLLGSGDMLYTPPQSSQIRRVQGALVEDHEVEGIVDFVTQDAVPSFSQELVQTATGSARAGSLGGGADEDDMWDEAVRIILKSRRGSASLLQRALGIGYTRASRLIDLMTAEGIVGEHKGSKAREVLLTIEQWEEMHGAPMGQGALDE
jgi:hypothetical protein